MSDLTMRLKLDEDVSQKLKKITSEGKNVRKEMKSIGEAIDEAFQANEVADFSDIFSEEFDDIGTSINNSMNTFVRSIDQSADKLEQALRGLDKSIPEDNNLPKIGDDADDASRSLSNLNGNADTLGSTLKRLFTIAAGAIAFDKLKEFSLDTLEESAAATARESQFSQVFAGLEESADASLGKIAADTGILENRMKESYTSVAAFAKTTGMETADAMELSNRAMVAVADSAAFYDKSMEEMTEGLRSYLKGNYENDALLGLSSTEFTRNAEAMEQYGKEFNDLTEEQKQWTLLSMVEDANELSGALGQAAREADTWSNQTGNLAQAWTDTKASLGDNIMDQSIGVVKTLTENMDEIEEPLGRIFDEAGDVIEELIPMIPSGLNAVATGIETIGSALGAAHDFVAENPKAIGTALTSIASGMIAMKAANSAGNIAKMLSGTNGLSGALSKLSTSIFGSPWAAGAAVVTASVAGIAMAIDNYNDLQVENNLAEHFGDIEFNASQIEDAASHILDAEYLVNINTALGEFENADILREDAEEALRNNDALEWKSSVGIELTPDEQTDYTNNIELFVESRIDELESRTYPAVLSVKTMLKTAEGFSLAEQMEQWAVEDQLQVQNLSAQLSAMVEQALTDGMIDVNEQAAIDILQSKINSILSGWKSSEAEAELDLIEQQYGGLSGKDLTVDTFSSIVEALGEQRETAAEALEANSKEFFEVINGLTDQGRLTEDENELYKEQWSEAVRNQRATDLLNSTDFEENTIDDTYGDRIAQNTAENQDGIQKRFDYLNSELQAGNTNLFDAIENSISSAMTPSGLFSGEEQGAIADLYEIMKPDATAMGELIDEYRAVGQEVPQELMDSFNETMEIGAAAGDSDAAWQLFANQMVADPANDALLEAIEDGTVAVPQELRTSLERAMAETTSDPLELNDMTAKIEDIQVDQDRVNELLENAADIAGLSTTGNVITLSGGQVVVEYEVESGQTLSQIAANAGIALDELLAVNPEITNPNVIEIGQEINIPASAVTVDSSEVGAAVEEQAKENVGNIVTEATAEATIIDSNTDSSEAYSAARDDLNDTFSEPMDTPGYADVIFEKQSDNIPEVYDQTGSELQSAFNTTFPVTAKAAITVDYSIANPTATIDISGDGTGTGVLHSRVGGYAEGGIVDSPQLAWIAEGGYPEAIIPLDGSDNAFSLWKETGDRLGVFGDFEGGDLKGAAFAPPEETDMRNEYVRNDSRRIAIDINGSGEISAGSSKAEIVNYIMDNIEDIILDIIYDEDVGEGDRTHEW